MKNRLFIAIEIPFSLQGRLCDTCRDIEERCRNARVVKRGNLHITLHFLGDVDQGLFASVCDSLDRACVGIRPFEIRVDGIGVFGHERRPRLIWAGVEAEQQLKELHRAAGEGLSELGVRIDGREYMPHITLVRFKDGRACRGIAEIIEHNRTAHFGSYTADSVVVMKSELSGSGPEYEAAFRRILNPDSAGDAR